MPFSSYTHLGPVYCFNGKDGVIYPNPSMWWASSSEWVRLVVGSEEWGFVWMWRHQGQLISRGKVQRSDCVPRPLPPVAAVLDWCPFAADPRKKNTEWTMDEVRSNCPLLDARLRYYLNPKHVPPLPETENDLLRERLAVVQLVASLHYRRPRLCPPEAKEKVVDHVIQREVDLFRQRLPSTSLVCWVQWLLRDLSGHSVELFTLDQAIARVPTLPPLPSPNANWESLRSKPVWMRVPFEWVLPYLPARSYLLHHGLVYMHMGQALTCAPHWYKVHVTRRMKAAAEVAGELDDDTQRQLESVYRLLSRYRHIWHTVAIHLRGGGGSSQQTLLQTDAVQRIAPPCVTALVQAARHPPLEPRHPRYFNDANRMLFYRTLLGCGVPKGEVMSLLAQRAEVVHPRDATKRHNLLRQNDGQLKYWSRGVPIVPKCEALSAWCAYTTGDIEDTPPPRQRCAQELTRRVSFTGVLRTPHDYIRAMQQTSTAPQSHHHTPVAVAMEEA